MNLESKIYVAGHKGLVGSAVLRLLRSQGYTNLLITEREGCWGVDLRNLLNVDHWFSSHRPEYVFLCAAKVGGIKYNDTHSLEMFLDNMQIERNVIMSAANYGCKKLLFLGSSCIYPRDCPQPIKEEYLLTGPIEKTTEAYALAKIAGVRLCQWLRKERGLNYISAMPCNIYGPGDRTDPEQAHIVPGIIARMHRAKIEGSPTFSVWGDGKARRELLYSSDLARALVTCMEKYDDPEPINTGSSDEWEVLRLTMEVKEAIGYKGEILLDFTQPTGTPRKILDNQKIFGLGWKPQIDLPLGLRLTYEDFCARDADYLRKNQA